MSNSRYYNWDVDRLVKGINQIFSDNSSLTRRVSEIARGDRLNRILRYRSDAINEDAEHRRKLAAAVRRAIARGERLLRRIEATGDMLELSAAEAPFTGTNLVEA
jgi:hypothetical protein